MFSKLITILLFASPAFASAEHVLEPLMGHFTTQGGVHIQVRSGGCTSKRDFTFVREVKNGVHQVSFYRTRPDVCRAYIRYGEILTFSFEELGLKDTELFSITNADRLGQVFDL